jgi:copper(I)-binding protein
MRFFLLLSLALLAACGSPQPPLVATDVEVTPPMPGRQMSAGYLVLTNNTDEAIVIDEVTSPHFGSVELHETTIENGMSRMRRIEELVIPANGSVTLERGGKHLMLMRSTGPNEIITLQFLSNGEPVLTIEQLYYRKMK